MTSGFLTLAKDDPRSAGYSEGTFDKEFCALPVSSLSTQSTPRRFSTYHVLHRSQVRRPKWWIIGLRLVRAEFLPLTLFPLLQMLLLLHSEGKTIVIPAAIFATMTLLFLHGAAFMMNDVTDHEKGIDTSGGLRGSGVIRKGWLATYQVRRLSSLFFAFGILSAIPMTIWVKGLLPFGLVGLLAIMAFTHRRLGLKYRGVGDSLVFLGFGPLLTLGTGRVFAEVWSVEYLWAGVFWGSFAVFVFHCRQLESLFSDSMAKSGTFIARIGFDRAKRFLHLEAMGLSVVFLAFVNNKPGWFIAWIIVTFSLLFLLRSVRRARSSLSSQLQNLGRRALWTYSMAFISAALLLFSW